MRLILVGLLPLLWLAAGCKDSGHQLGNVLDAAAGSGGGGTAGGGTGAAGSNGDPCNGGAMCTTCGGAVCCLVGTACLAPTGTGGIGGSTPCVGGSAGGAGGAAGAGGIGGFGIGPGGAAGQGSNNSGIAGGGGRGGTGPAQVCNTGPDGSCPTNQICDLDTPGLCGAAVAYGHCINPPSGFCFADYTPVCGCDHTYSNDCARQLAGVQLNHRGICTDGGATPSNCRECDPDTQYCQETDGAAGMGRHFDGCMALPAACDPIRSCACLSTVSCGSICGDLPRVLPMTVLCPAPQCRPDN